MKRCALPFREAYEMRPREASGWPNEVSRETEPAWAFSCTALGGFRVAGIWRRLKVETTRRRRAKVAWAELSLLKPTEPLRDLQASA